MKGTCADLMALCWKVPSEIGFNAYNITIGSNLYILNGDTNETSSTILQVIVDHGASAPLISCISSRFTPTTDLMWTRDGSLPRGVTQSYEFEPYRQHQRLMWTRNPAYSDSGLYSCTTSVRHDIDTRPEIDLIVRSKRLFFVIG